MADILIFDWDGTIHNTKALYGSAFRKAYTWLVSEGLAPQRYYTDDEMAKYLGLNAQDMWNTFMPHLPEDIKEKCSEMVGNAMVTEIENGSAVLYPGAEEMLRTLKDRGYTLLFLSNCKHRYMEAHRKEFDLDRFFSDYYACEDYDFIPKTEIFLTIKKEHPGSFAVIGDRFSDIDVAVKHELPSVGCSYGFGDMSELETCTFIASDVSEIPGFIEKLNNK